VKQSMLKALANVAPRHLLDTRLNPPGELRALTAPLKRGPTDEKIPAVVEGPSHETRAQIIPMADVGHRFSGAVPD
jgi:hypothetical protein